MFLLFFFKLHFVYIYQKVLLNIFDKMWRKADITLVPKSGKYSFVRTLLPSTNIWEEREGGDTSANIQTPHNDTW